MKGPLTPATDPARLAVADANPLALAALKELFERTGQFTVVCACTGGGALLDQLAKLECDVVVTGWRLSDMTAADLLERIKAAGPPRRVTVLSAETSPKILRHCIKLGAMGFCWQTDEPQVLLDTVHAVAKGRISWPYVDVSRMDDTPLSALTPRELDLLQALSDGWTNQQIAARFGISENTVKYHLKNVYDKLGVKNRAMALTVYLTDERRRD